jgi:uncharacterized protein (DUF952 family)
MIDQDERPPMNNQPVPEPSITYHLAPRDIWLAAATSAHYLPEAYTADGFIHCTDGAAEVVAVGNRYYQGDPRPYVVLAISRARLTAPVKYEDAGRIFPHVYGPLNTEAVVEVLQVHREPDGRFVSFGEE